MSFFLKHMEGYTDSMSNAALDNFVRKGVWSDILCKIRGDLCNLYGVDGELAPLDLPLWVADAEETGCPLVYVSTGFEEFSGYEREFVIGRRCQCLELTDQVLNEILNGEEQRRVDDFCGNRVGGNVLVALMSYEKLEEERQWCFVRMEKLTVKGHLYVFAVYHRVDLPLDLLLFGEGQAAIRSLRLRLQAADAEHARVADVLHIIEQQIFSWICSPVEQSSAMKQILCSHSKRCVSIPQIGIELDSFCASGPPSGSVFHMLSCIREGVQHFYLGDLLHSAEHLSLAFEMLSKMQTYDGCSLPPLFFTVRIPIDRMDQTLELCSKLFASSVGWPSLLLLDVCSSERHEAIEAWQKLQSAATSRAHHHRDVPALGLWGAGLKTLEAISDSCRSGPAPEVFAFEMSPVVDSLAICERMIDQCETLGIQPLAYECFGRADNVLSNECVDFISTHHNVDPEIFVAAWLEKKGVAAVANHWNQCQRRRVQVHDITSLITDPLPTKNHCSVPGIEDHIAQSPPFSDADFEVLDKLPKMSLAKLKLRDLRQSVVDLAVNDVLAASKKTKLLPCAPSGPREAKCPRYRHSHPANLIMFADAEDAQAVKHPKRHSTDAVSRSQPSPDITRITPPAAPSPGLTRPCPAATRQRASVAHVPLSDPMVEVVDRLVTGRNRSLKEPTMPRLAGTGSWRARSVSCTRKSDSPVQEARRTSSSVSPTLSRRQLHATDWSGRSTPRKNEFLASRSLPTRNLPQIEGVSPVLQREILLEAERLRAATAVAAAGG